MPDPAGAGAPAGKIVPRWEWRTFDHDFGATARRLEAIPTEQVQDSDEIYLVSARSDASCKLRDGLFDLKHLEEVAAPSRATATPARSSPPRS